jgi:hypothetical protein
MPCHLVLDEPAVFVFKEGVQMEAVGSSVTLAPTYKTITSDKTVTLILTAIRTHLTQPAFINIC